MSATELIARSPSTTVTERELSGWGRVAPSRCRVSRPLGSEEILGLLGRGGGARRGVIARGAGCSYGDAAQIAGGEVLDMTGLDRIISIDPGLRLVRAQAGATLAQLMARLAAYGLTLPVVPGTRHVTLAGAIASDIHGKNHHRDGGFARHVAAISLCTPAGEQLELTPEEDAELFYATLGGMGLTGVILEATVRAEELASPWVAEDVDRTAGLAETLELLAGEESRRYSVAWLDLLAPGSKMGRAVLSRADSLDAESARELVPSRRRPGASYPGSLSRRPALEIPAGVPGGLLRRRSMRAFNELRWRASPKRERGRPLAIAPYFFPLDVIGSWNRLYGPAGLVQYQLAIPSGEEAALERCFELIRIRRLPVYLAVFKRFGAAFGGPLSFPLEGWTLAIDLPADAPGLGSALEDLDEIVGGCGGRVYLSKDIRLRRALLERMYPRLADFQAVRARVDPENVLRSDLGLRLGLCGDPS